MSRKLGLVLLVGFIAIMWQGVSLAEQPNFLQDYTNNVQFMSPEDRAVSALMARDQYQAEHEGDFSPRIVVNNNGDTHIGTQNQYGTFAIGNENQTYVSVDGDGNVIKLTATQENQGSQQDASTTVSTRLPGGQQATGRDGAGGR